MRNRMSLLSVSICLTIAFLVSPANAVVNELVSSSESHSIEKFNSVGTWLKTFASTGPRIPFGLSVSPITKDVFVATNTETILRYHSSGLRYAGAGWTSFDVTPYFGVNPVISLLFDPAGNLYVASYFGTSGYQVQILVYPKTQVTKSVPVPVKTITTTLGRGDQMAFDALGNICIASFIAPNTVQCYNPVTSALTFDYAGEFSGFSPLIQPVGIAFGTSPTGGNILYASSVFQGQIVSEVVPHGAAMTGVASGMVSDVNYLTTDSAGLLYLPSYHNPGGRYGGSNFCTFYTCNDYDFSSDVVYRVDPISGTVTNFITANIWGPYQLVFVPF